ncbi:hypothetical protein FOPE_01669 [Fonsecaea pedrosoi]|nr:hypothetical protein FOPE_01669 [Fonsecaea pedrosoi]
MTMTLSSIPVLDRYRGVPGPRRSRSMDHGRGLHHDGARKTGYTTASRAEQSITASNLDGPRRWVQDFYEGELKSLTASKVGWWHTSSSDVLGGFVCARRWWQKTKTRRGKWDKMTSMQDMLLPLSSAVEGYRERRDGHKQDSLTSISEVAAGPVSKWATGCGGRCGVYLAQKVKNLTPCREPPCFISILSEDRPTWSFPCRPTVTLFSQKRETP